MSKIRLAFIGTGAMGQCAHLRNYAVDPAVEITAIAELRPGLRAQVAARYGIPRTYADHHQLLAREEVDGLIAIQPFSIHGRLIPELLAAGVPVLTEKPLARSLEAADTILAAAKAGPGSLFVAYHKRSDPAIMAAVALISRWRQSGEMGRMRLVRLSMPPGDWIAGGFSQLIGSEEPVPSLEGDPAPRGMTGEAARAYDAFVNYYIHQVNLMAHLTGSPISVVHADPGSVILVTRSESGVTGCLEMQAFRSTVDWQEECLVTFEKGWIRVALPPPLAVHQAGTLTVFRDPGGGEGPTTTTTVLPRIHAMAQQAANFVRTLRGEESPICPAELARADLVVAQDAIAWARKGALATGSVPCP